MTKIISILAVVALVATYGFAKWRSQYIVVQAGFWFEDVTFDVPHLRAAGVGEPLSEEEKRIVEAVAWAELRAAFSGLRVVFSDDRKARYKVCVVQQYPDGRGTGAAGQSRVLRPLGGTGSVNFLMLASQAISHAPPGTTRAAIVEAIGRGIGRGAVHEFAHQLLPGVPIHESKDAESYEFAFSSRPAQYYGEMRWDIAWAPLVEKFGPVDATRAAAQSGNPE